jgi:hypothetical protein
MAISDGGNILIRGSALQLKARRAIKDGRRRALFVLNYLCACTDDQSPQTEP